MSDAVSRSWFVVFNNPEKHGYKGTPDEILEKLKQEWIGDKPLRKGWWSYCISAKGLPHIHMVLEGSGAMRFSSIKKCYPNAHLEPTKGSKKQVLAYIKKEAPYDEKKEQVISSTSYGNIEGFKRYAVSNNNEVLNVIEELIEEGLTPSAIMAEDIRLRDKENLIRKAFFAKRYKETPPMREVRVYWHTGLSSSGKSYSYVKLCEQRGDDAIYFFSDYSNRGVGGFDGYQAEPILFIDELKRDNAIPYQMLLTILDGYRTQIHCRFANCYALWSEIHITSIYSPEDIYEGMVSRELRTKDTIKQLLRRIDQYIYHYQKDGEYKTFELSSEQYHGIEDLREKAIGNEFKTIKDEDVPF